MPNLPRLRALALFGRRSVEPAEPLCCRRPKTITKHEVAALQPAAREQEPRGREPGEKIVVAMESSRPENRVLQTSLRKELSMSETNTVSRRVEDWRAGLGRSSCS